MKILLIEDEKDLGESIISYLKSSGNICDYVRDFDEANQAIHLYQYDCIIVDITLPDGSGLEIIRNLKAGHSRAGVIIISAKNALDDKLTGLELGADDYLTKPFHLAELNARIRSVIRRRQYDGENQVVFNEIMIKPDEFKVFVNTGPVELTKKEFGLLLYFVTNRNQALTKEMIAEQLWGSQADLVDSFEFIYSHMKNLRKKLIAAGAKDYIQTVYGIGYRFGE
jgi:DNA-binding response OmpR family regulator